MIWQRPHKNQPSKNHYPFLLRRISVIGLFVFCLILLLAVFGDLICPYSPTKIIARDRFQGPNPVHIFGTDDMGRDTLPVSLMVQG